jgi:hypothetical protein
LVEGLEIIEELPPFLYILQWCSTVLRIRDPVLFYPPDPGCSNGRIRDVAMVGSGSGAFLPPGSGIRIRNGAMVGSGIKHPGSATLVHYQP